MSASRVSTRFGRMYKVGAAAVGAKSAGSGYFPSVTAVLGMIDKPGLIPWAIRLTLDHVRADAAAVARHAEPQQGAVVHAPTIEPGWLEDALVRASSVVERHKKAAAEFGTRAHDAINEIITQASPAAAAPAITLRPAGLVSSSRAEQVSTSSPSVASTPASDVPVSAAAATSASLASSLASSTVKNGTPAGAAADANADSDIAAVVEGFRRWYSQCGIALHPAGDSVVYSRRYRYAGAADALGVRVSDGALVVVDFKTSNSVHPTYALQLAAYSHAVREMIADGELSLVDADGKPLSFQDFAATVAAVGAGAPEQHARTHVSDQTASLAFGSRFGAAGAGERAACAVVSRSGSGHSGHHDSSDSGSSSRRRKFKATADSLNSHVSPSDGPSGIATGHNLHVAGSSGSMGLVQQHGAIGTLDTFDTFGSLDVLSHAAGATTELHAHVQPVGSFQALYMKSASALAPESDAEAKAEARLEAVFAREAELGLRGTALESNLQVDAFSPTPARLQQLSTAEGSAALSSAAAAGPAAVSALTGGVSDELPLKSRKKASLSGQAQTQTAKSARPSRKKSAAVSAADSPLTSPPRMSPLLGDASAEQDAEAREARVGQGDHTSADDFDTASPTRSRADSEADHASGSASASASASASKAASGKSSRARKQATAVSASASGALHATAGAGTLSQATFPAPDLGLAPEADCADVAARDAAGRHASTTSDSNSDSRAVTVRLVDEDTSSCQMHSGPAVSVSPGSPGRRHYHTTTVAAGTSDTSAGETSDPVTVTGAAAAGADRDSIGGLADVGRELEMSESNPRRGQGKGEGAAQAAGESASMPLPVHPDHPDHPVWRWPVEALVVRLDKSTGQAYVSRVGDVDAAFSAFKACLLLWNTLNAGAGTQAASGSGSGPGNTGTTGSTGAAAATASHGHGQTGSSSAAPAALLEPVDA